MFSSLASYILGNGNRNATDNITENNRNSTEVVDELELVAKSCEDDEEWLLVDRRDGDYTPQQTDSEEEIPVVEIKNNPPNRVRHNRNNSNVGAQDGAVALLPSSPIPNSMDESWFVTPPPCFTASDLISLETSPLENLLIEHPSMSVYHSVRSYSQQEDEVGEDGLVVIDLRTEPLVAVDQDRDLEVEFDLHPASERASGQTITVVRNRADHHANHLTEQQMKQVIALKHSQKAHEKKYRQQMCRKAMERSNKVREVNSKGGRQRRSDMTHCKVISRANNNRKC